MLTELFRGIFDTEMTEVIPVSDFLLCIVTSLILGLVIALAYTFRTRYTTGFVATLALLPATVCVVIMMVNGNVGAGVAVAGAFSLVRFRSAPGSAKEIGAIFLAMGTGLITGMGYLAYAVLFTLILSGAGMLYALLNPGAGKRANAYRTMRITIPEELDYEHVFDDILAEYTDRYEVTAVKTTNMGSLFRLTYDLKMKKGAREKEMIDRLRVRNGNLEITVSRQGTEHTEL